MAQVSKYPIRDDVAKRIFQIFIKTLIAVKKEEDAYDLMEDFFSPTEQIMLAKRLSIAFLLEKGYDYRSIRTILRVSSPTIASVNLSLKYKGKGYKNVINKILKEEEIRRFLENSVIKLLSLPAKSPKGGGTWRYLKQELEKNKNKNRKAF